MLSKFLIINRIGFLLAIAMLFVSCASVKVDDQTVKTSGTSHLRKPKVIYVQAFKTAGGQWNVDREGEELAAFKENAAHKLQGNMIERFPEIAPTKPAPEKLPDSGLLVTGQFVRVNQGSRALRMTIGFGAGGTKVETRVQLYDLATSKTQPVARFATTGGSNAEPGLVAGGLATGVIGGAVTAAVQADGLTADWERTSREVRNFIIKNFK